VQESRMHCSWIDEVTQAKLSDTGQALHIRMLQDIEEEVVRNRKETEDRVVDYLVLVYHFAIRHTSQLCQRYDNDRPIWK